MYVITTPPTKNVGDHLITRSAKNIIKKVKGDVEILEYSMQDDLTDKLEKINKCKAFIIPSFAIREPFHPETFRFVPDMTKIKIPIYPLGMTWKGFPGDHETVRTFRFQNETLQFLKYISKQVPKILCRDHLTCQVLKNHGISNLVMGGDPAWYDYESFGKPMKRSKKIETLVFTTPHAGWFNEQAKKILEMLSDLFPNARKICSIHGGNGVEDFEIGQHAEKNGFETIDVSNHLDQIDYYRNADLHVGYRLHGHIAFLSKRIPSILLVEDSRGGGFSYSMGIGGFNAFKRLYGFEQKWHFATHRGRERIMAADDELPNKIKVFLEEELESKFRRYLGIPELIDETYQQIMKPYVESIP
jgi:hypothetical protein